MSSLVDDINDKHLGPWAEACSKDGIENTPLNPYLHQVIIFLKPVFYFRKLVFLAL